MSEARIAEISSKLASFPGMPGAAVTLLGLLDDPDTPMTKIENALQHDPGLTANVLKLANSAYFGVPQKIGSIKQAVVMMGNRRLLQVVMASCMQAVMNKPVPGYDLPPGELLHHCMAVSVAAEGLVKELQLGQPDVIFTGALLHDVGKLALGQFLQEEYAQIQAEASRGISFEIAERKVLGMDHAEIGAKILEQWSLPSEIVAAVRYHHAPDEASPTEVFIDAVHVANVLCMMLGIGVGREGLQYVPSAGATKRLGLKSGHLEKVASQTLQWINELSDLMEVNG